MKLSCLRLTLQADNDFYSQREQVLSRSLPLCVDSLRKLPVFLPCPVDPQTGNAIVNKTGLGSSAALITSVVGALLSFFSVVELPHEREAGGMQRPHHLPSLRLTHNLAQLCHAIAQGKVGSGFDVSAATYGSQAYTRFSPDVLRAVLDSIDGDSDAGASPSSLLRCVTLPTSEGGGCWDVDVSPLTLPPGISLMMGDVCGGSSTPSMVRRVLSWKRGEASTSAEDALAHWDRLVDGNRRFAACLRALADLHAQDGAVYTSTLAACAAAGPEGWLREAGAGAEAGAGEGVATALTAVREAFLVVRRLLKEVGEQAMVPIEPNEQSTLADATMAIPGVVCAGVPGAGGVDAIFALVIGGAPAVERVENMWASWHGTAGGGGLVSPLLVSSSPPGVGVFVEDATMLS